jgi:hypothetical protein
MRQTLDEYLDGALDAAAKADVERRLLADPAAATLLAQMKSERALRTATFATFEPTKTEADALAARTLASFEHAKPAGYVGIWLRRGIAAAAMIALVAGSFAIGRITASPPAPSTPIVTTTDPHVIYRVMYLTDAGETQVREFTSVEDASDFMAKVDLKADAQVAVMDLDSSGSF